MILVRRARPALRACKAFRAHRGKLAPRVRKAPKVRQEKRATKVEKGDVATVNVRAVQADGSVSCEANETLVSVFCPSGGAPRSEVRYGADCWPLFTKALGDVRCQGR